MSNQHGNEQDLTYSHPENGTNDNNDKQQKKMKPLTAFVQIAFAGPTNPEKVVLSQNCSTVAEHAAFLKEKINESEGDLIGLQLNGPVALAAIFSEHGALMDHDVPLEVDCKYTFRFKLANLQEELHEPDPVEKLAKQVAKLSNELAKYQAQHEQMRDVNYALKRLAAEEAEKVANLEAEQTKQRGQVRQLEKERDTLKKRVEELEEGVKKHQKLLEEEEKRMAAAEYARLLGVPTVANLKAHFDRDKLLQLIQNGNIPSIYIQSTQQLKDKGILQSIVDMLATAEKPEQMVVEVKIEHYGVLFNWPKREELKLKERKSNVAITYNEASACPETYPDQQLAEYELTNRGGCNFQVLIHYCNESYFNNSVFKFIYNRLP